MINITIIIAGLQKKYFQKMKSGLTQRMPQKPPGIPVVVFAGNIITKPPGCLPDGFNKKEDGVKK